MILIMHNLIMHPWRIIDASPDWFWVNLSSPEDTFSISGHESVNEKVDLLKDDQSELFGPPKIVAEIRLWVKINDRFWH